jgi:hypothetical protein
MRPCHENPKEEKKMVMEIHHQSTEKKQLST